MQETLNNRLVSASQRDFDSTVDAFRRGLAEYVKGDPGPVMALFSRQADVTLANPLGPPRRGPADVTEAGTAGAAFLRDGSPPRFEEIARYSTGDIGYVLQIERTQARVAGGENLSRIALRVTLIFRREGNTWWVVHRHADPITTPRPITTAIEPD